MKKSELMKKNLLNYYIGWGLLAFAGVLVSYFLPFYLKEEGFTILEIGTLATIGIALGNLIGSSLFGRLLRKIKLKTGLFISSIFHFLGDLMFYISPSITGFAMQKGSEKIGTLATKIGGDSFIQHNTSKRTHRKVTSIILIIESLSIVLGLILSVVGMIYFGFLNTLLIFMVISLISVPFYNKIDDKHRIKINKSYGNLKISRKLKTLMVAEVIYWLALASSMVIVITFLVTDYFGGGSGWLAIVFGTLFLSISISGFIAEKYLGKKNLYSTSILGMFLLMLSAVIIIFSTNLYVLVAALILEGIGAGIWVPSKTALYWKFTKRDLREKASAYLGGRRLFVGSLGPLVGGLLVTYLGILSPFYFKVVICIISIGIYVFLMRND